LNLISIYPCQQFPSRSIVNSKRPSSAFIIAFAASFCGSPTATCVCDNGCPLNAFTTVPLIREFCPAGGCPSAAVTASTIVSRKAALCALISPLSPDQATCYDFRQLARLCAARSRLSPIASLPLTLAPSSRSTISIGGVSTPGSTVSSSLNRSVSPHCACRTYQSPTG